MEHQPHEPSKAPPRGDDAAGAGSTADIRSVELWVSGQDALPKPGERIGSFQLLRKLGEGGFGVVFLADQESPVRRRVALKLIKPGMDSRTVIARFEAERQALALMDHPNVARIFDAGLTPPSMGSRPFFVMEYVPGVPVNDFCTRHRLELNQRLELFIEVCQAIQHAHQKGVIHRDLKPSNVLVEYLDGKAVPKVIDFGVAKAMHQHLTERTLVTQEGQMLGTVGYMAPEQAERTALDIDTRADIYALGVLLYQLLTDLLPFDPAMLASAGSSEMQRIIREVEPPCPSVRLAQRLSTLASSGAPTVEAPARKSSVSVRSLRGDLDWIVMKCLEKDRSRRYESADALALDVRRHLDSEPVSAGPPSMSYRFGKFARRNRAALIGACFVAAAMVLGTGAATYGLFQANRERAIAQEARDAESVAREKADQERLAAEQYATFLTEMLRSVDPKIAAERDTTLLRMVLDDATERVETELADHPVIEARLRATLTTVYEAIGQYPEGELHARRALELLQRMPEANREDVHEAANNLAVLLWRQAKNEDAEPLLKGILAAAAQGEPISLPTLRAASKNLARVFRSQARYDEAQALIESMLQDQRRQGQPDPDDRLDLLAMLADLHLDRHQPERAEVLYAEVFDGRRQTRGESHPATFVAMINLANVWRELKRLDEAETMLKQAHEGCLQVLGPDHPDTLMAASKLAQVYQLQRRYEEADQLFQQVIAIRERVLGPDHPHTLIAVGAQAAVWARQKRYDMAVPPFRELLVRTERRRGPDHPETLSAAHNLALALRETQRYEEAAGLYERALAGRRRVLGSQDALTIGTMNDLATVYQTLGRLQEADTLLREAVENARAAFGPDDYRTGAFLGYHGGVLVDLQRFDDAETVLLESIRILTAARGERDPLTQWNLATLVKLYETQGRGDDATTWRARLVEP